MGNSKRCVISLSFVVFFLVCVIAFIVLFRSSCRDIPYAFQAHVLYHEEQLTPIILNLEKFYCLNQTYPPTLDKIDVAFGSKDDSIYFEENSALTIEYRPKTLQRSEYEERVSVKRDMDRVYLVQFAPRSYLLIERAETSGALAEAVEKQASIDVLGENEASIYRTSASVLDAIISYSENTHRGIKIISEGMVSMEDLVKGGYIKDTPMLTLDGIEYHYKIESNRNRQYLQEMLHGCLRNAFIEIQEPSASRWRGVGKPTYMCLPYPLFDFDIMYSQY